MRGFPQSVATIDRRFKSDVRAFILDELDADIDTAQAGARAIYCNVWDSLPRAVKLGLVILHYYAGNEYLWDLTQVKQLIDAEDYKSAACIIMQTVWARESPEKAQAVTNLILAGVVS